MLLCVAVLVNLTAPLNGDMQPEEQAQSLVAYFLQSKKALTHGQALCSRVSTISAETASVAIEAVAYEAKARWMNEGFLDQLNLAAAISKSLSLQRTKLLEEARRWDSLRTERNQSLDAILENLGQQHVPPNLHLMSSGSSLFGSQHSIPDITEIPDEEIPPPDAGTSSPADVRSKWKTLRDFVDGKVIEDALEQMEEDRNALDDILASTVTHPGTLNEHIANIRAILPQMSPSPRSMDVLLAEQDSTATEMASRLEGLTAHFDQMSRALKDEESGHPLSEDDIIVLVRDTNHLPTILTELEAAARSIESVHEQTTAFRDSTRAVLETYGQILLQLENLETIMDAMLEDHTQLQNDAAFVHQTLETRYMVLRELEEMYHSYQLAYDHLILEMDRRSRYRNAVQALVDDMTAQLQALRTEEMEARERFINDHGRFLPEDLCPYIPDLPLMYVLDQEGSEGAVNLEAGVVAEAKRNLGIADPDGEV